MKLSSTFQFNNSIPIPFEQSSGLENLSTYEARLSLLKLAICADYDELICLNELNSIDKHWYQMETAKKVIKHLGGRAILADEVGLGKTIEAGMITKEYLCRSMIKSLLVLTPATLVSQWQSELDSKFGIVTETTDSRDVPPSQFWTVNDQIVASLPAAKHKAHWQYVTSRQWDLVVVDEAHHLKNRSTLNWKLVNSLQKRFILLLTATPVQNNLLELYNLLTLLKPGLLSTEAQFKREYIKGKDGRRVKNPAQLRQLMGEVMVRNTRSGVDVKLPKRFASTIVCQPSPKEKELYLAINAYLLQHPTELDKLTRNNLLMRAGSSPPALQETLLTLEKRFDHDELKFLGKWAHQVTQSVKAQQLVALLTQAKNSKTLVFINHRATQSYLARVLNSAGIEHTEFRGNLSLKAKDAAIERWREDVPVMLASETGGEGRNLQFANTIVNYDLPWNPMRIEQRIGRLHRIGQTQDVYIFNFCYANSLEEYILKVLHEKINLFELVVGEIDTILGQMGEEFDFSEEVVSLWLQNQSPHQRDDAFEQLANQLLHAKHSYSQIQEYEQELFGEDFEA